MPSASITPTGCCSRCGASGQGFGRVRAGSPGTMRSISSAENFMQAEQRHGAEARVALLLCRHHGPRHARRHQPAAPRQEIFRLPFHHLRQSGLSGFAAGAGSIAGPDPREMAKSDLVVIWGTNAVNTQVNVMTHAIARAQGTRRQDRRRRHLHERHHGAGRSAGAGKPGTDGALACAVMHCLFRDGHADWDYLDKYTDAPRELEAHLRTRDPEWASRITGTPVGDDRGIRAD